MENKADFKKIEGFDWDESNLNKSWIKHKVYFKEAEEVFINKPFFTFKDIEHSGKEDRFAITGRTNKGRLLIVFFTVRSGRFRIISARDQNKKERKDYEKNIQENTKI